MTIHSFFINNHKELIDKIAKWNLTREKYPKDFPKDKIKPLQNDYITMEDYRLKMEPLFYLECWEPFKDFNIRLNKKEINFEEEGVIITVSDFYKSENTIEDTDLYDCTFELLLPHYFIYGYQGIKFSEKMKEDSDIERRTSGDIKKHDLIYLARMSKDFKKTYYSTVVMSNITKDFDKDLVSIFNRTNLYKYSPVICTKNMTQTEIDELQDELKRKREKDNFWIAYHIMTFGTVKKEFKTLDLMIRMPSLYIRKEITSGKCRNENTSFKDRSNEVIDTIMRNYNLDDQLLSLLIKIYKNNILFKDERETLIRLLVPRESIGKEIISKEVKQIINNINKGIFPFPIQDKRILYKAILSSEGQEMDSELETFLYNTDEETKLNKTIKEVIQQYGLNKTQATVLAKVNNEKFLSLIQGPPGTGKTKMILALIYQELRIALKKNKKSKILVCAPSNAACNEITRRLKKENINTNIMTVRFVVDDNVDNTISHVSVDKVYFRKLYYYIINEKNNLFNLTPAFNIPNDTIEKLSIHNENIQHKIRELLIKRDLLNKQMSEPNKVNSKKIINKLYQKICRLENELDEYIQIFIDNILLIDIDEFEDYKNFIIRTAKKCKLSVFKEADVIVTTLSSSNNEYFKAIQKQFTLLIVDEASQASELTTLIPFCHNIPKAILIGDPKQLPPTILSDEVSENNYGRSLFQRLQENSPNSVHLLNIQYRMHPDISKLSSRCFYSNEIINGENVKSKAWQKEWCLNPEFGPLMFYDINGVTNYSNNSLNNVTEANQVLNFITQLLQITPKVNFNSRIAVISPYRAQVLLIRNKLRAYYKQALATLNIDHAKEIDFSGDKIALSDENKEILRKINILDHISVNTVDSYQGQESDIVLLTCVRSNTKNVGFLADKRRLNVAITRARFTLIIFGNSETLCKNKYWANIITEIKEMKCFKTNATDYFKYSKRFPKNLFPKSYFK